MTLSYLQITKIYYVVNNNCLGLTKKNNKIVRYNRVICNHVTKLNNNAVRLQIITVFYKKNLFARYNRHIGITVHYNTVRYNRVICSQLQ